MDFQAMYENMQTEIKNKVAQISDKKNEIAVLEADVYKIQGAIEMLVLISKQMEQQIIDVYNSLLKNINCTDYKSNHRVFVENTFETKVPQKLNLRIVVNKWKGIQPDSWNTYEYPQRLHNSCHEFLSDLFVIANNLGFAIDSNSSHNVEWYAGEKQDFYAVKNGKKVMLMSVKVYLNDNIHLKLNKEFNYQINVIKGKHEGWLHSIDDVIEEFEVSDKEAFNLFQGMPNITYNIAGLLN